MLIRRALFLVAVLLLVGCVASAMADASSGEARHAVADAADGSAGESTTESPGPLSLQSPRGPLLKVEELTAELGANFEAMRRTVRTDIGGPFARYDQKNRSTRFEEYLGLSSSGSIVSEKVLLYDAMIRGGLSQEDYKESRPGFDLSRDPDGTLLEYDLRLHAFPQGRLSATANASQLRDRLQRPFLPSLDRTRERYGAALIFNDPKLPMQLTFDHLYDDLTSDSRYLTDDEELAEDTLRYEATWNPTEDHSLNINYEYENRNDRYSGTRDSFTTTRNYLALNDAIQFGEDRRSRLDTFVRVEEERGDLPRDAVEVAPQLRFQHTDDLFSLFRTQYLKQNYFDLSTETFRGEAGLTHTLFKSLTNTINLYALEQRADRNADATEWGSMFNSTFSKENAWGRSSANLSYHHSQTRTSDGRRDGITIEETLTFRDPLPVYLAQRNINLATLVVMAADRSRLFLAGRDYAIVKQGELTSLVRNPTGMIVDGQTVLVTYSYRAFNDYGTTRDRIDLRLAHRFKNGIEPYYALSLQDEDLSDDRYLVFQERDINRHRLGVAISKPRWAASAEYEYNHDGIDPYQAGHFTGDVTVLQDLKQQAALRGALSHFRFDGNENFDSRDTTLLDLGAFYRYTLAPSIEANATALYRFQNDSLFGETNGVDLTASVSWKLGLFTLLVEAEYDMLDLPTSTDNTAALWVKVRREIPIIGKPRS